MNFYYVCKRLPSGLMLSWGGVGWVEYLQEAQAFPSLDDAQALLTERLEAEHVDDYRGRYEYYMLEMPVDWPDDYKHENF